MGRLLVLCLLVSSFTSGSFAQEPGTDFRNLMNLHPVFQAYLAGLQREGHASTSRVYRDAFDYFSGVQADIAINSGRYDPKKNVTLQGRNMLSDKWATSILQEYLGSREPRHQQKATEPTVKTISGSVVRVVDGDTLLVAISSGDVTVRLIGVNTPETKDPRREVEYFGAEAAAFTSHVAPPGSRVTLELDVEWADRYDRALAYVYLSNGEMLNALLVRNGYAHADRHPPNVRYADYFLELEQQARAQGVGLWGQR